MMLRKWLRRIAQKGPRRRQAILDALADGPMCGLQIRNKCREAGVSMYLGTLYSELDYLCEQRKIERLQYVYRQTGHRAMMYGVVGTGS